MMEGFKAMFYVKVEVESRFWFETELRNKETSLIFILFYCTWGTWRKELDLNEGTEVRAIV